VGEGGHRGHRGRLPFPLAGSHYDNGVEFIRRGTSLLRGSAEGSGGEPHRFAVRLNVQQTASGLVSRETHKGDPKQAVPQERQRGIYADFAEQKNYDAVRKTVGHFRFDNLEERDALAEVYKYLCPLYNYWHPSFRLIDKVKQENGLYKKNYGKNPKTPYQRLLESPDVSGENKTKLARLKDTQNPVVLNSRLNEAVERLLKINAEKTNMKQASC
jgi:hypothetical protein